MADYYENLAADYDWLFDDDALASGLAINHPATARLLERTSHASAVLDAACGTGVSAAALARRGYHVWAADGSDAMVEMAAARFRREHLEIPLVRCMWADLPAAVDERFDVVLCIGNSLVHAAGRDAMIQALTGFRQVVRPGVRIARVVVGGRVVIVERTVSRDDDVVAHELRAQIVLAHREPVLAREKVRNGGGLGRFLHEDEARRHRFSRGCALRARATARGRSGRRACAALRA